MAGPYALLLSSAIVAGAAPTLRVGELKAEGDITAGTLAAITAAIHRGAATGPCSVVNDSQLVADYVLDGTLHGEAQLLVLHVVLREGRSGRLVDATMNEVPVGFGENSLDADLLAADLVSGIGPREPIPPTVRKAASKRPIARRDEASVPPLVGRQVGGQVEAEEVSRVALALPSERRGERSEARARARQVSPFSAKYARLIKLARIGTGRQRATALDLLWEQCDHHVVDACKAMIELGETLPFGRAARIWGGLLMAGGAVAMVVGLGTMASEDGDPALPLVMGVGGLVSGGILYSVGKSRASPAGYRALIGAHENRAAKRY